jgi:tripartite-type tricarboxylate transporter receptor subunit TctC
MKSGTRITWVVALLALTCGSAAHAQVPSAPGSYPVKPIRLISPFAPGGGASLVARMIGPELGESLGQTIVIDNRPGGGGVVGTEIAARSLPDGYTLLMATLSNAVINPLVSKVSYDPVRDFTAIAHTSTVPLILVVHPSVPAKSVKEFIAYARSPAARVNFASSGEGAANHLAAELFKNLAGVSMSHVPYRGGGLAIIDIVAGHVQTGFMNILEALPHVNSGRLRGLAVSTSRRSAVAPAIPTVAESGVPGYEVTQWSGVLGPAGLPRGIVTRLNAEIMTILGKSAMRERLISSGAEPGGGSPEQFAAIIKSDTAKWSKVLKTVKLEIVR